jgi:4-amino-4-deoxy-L-arabinose transferase-like glycosyltransferase
MAAILLLIGAMLLLLVYYRAMFSGLTSPDALDYAQLARNLARGRGFVTLVLRPLALTHGGNSLTQPDLNHGPLYPVLLALAFRIVGVTEPAVVMVSGLFYLLTIPMIYCIGVRLFNRTVGFLAASVVVCNALLLQYAISGLPITLYVFLMTSLLLVMYRIAHVGEAQDSRLPWVDCVLAGLLTGLLYLTDPVFFLIIPFTIIAVIWLNPRHRIVAPVSLCLPMLLLILPWMVRNSMLSGNPVFGLRGTEIWMSTKGFYPGVLAYREMSENLIHGVGIFQAVVQKLLLGAGTMIQTFPEVTASWVLAFFLPCLLFRFSDPATNAVRRVMMWYLTGIFLGALALQIEMQLFVAVIPAMLVFAIAYLLHLIEQANLPRTSINRLTVLMAVAVCFPLISDMTLIAKPRPIKERLAAQDLGRQTPPDATVLSDQPWIVAWYADRPSIWLPVVDLRIADLRRQFPQTRWLFLTLQTRGLSENWLNLYDGLARWNLASHRAVAANQPVKPLTIRSSGQSGSDLSPLLEALDGFTALASDSASTADVMIARALPDDSVNHRVESADSKP